MEADLKRGISIRGVSDPKGSDANSFALLRSLNRLSLLPDAQEYLEGMIDLMIAEARAGSAVFFSLVEEKGEAVITAARGDIKSSHLLGLRLACNTEILNPNVEGAYIFTAGNLYDDPGWMRAASPGDAIRMQNMVILPVRLARGDLGLIHLYNSQAADLGQLQVLADRLAFDLDQRGQLQQAQSQTQRLQGLLEAIRQITGILNRNQLLYSITEQACRLVGAERSTAFIVDPETHETIYNVAFQESNQPQLKPQPEAGSNGRGEAKNSEAQQKKRPFSYLTKYAISAPIMNGDDGEDKNAQTTTLGGVMVLNKRKGTFEEQDAHVLETLAEHAGSLLQVAELYESSEKLFLDAIRSLVAAIDAKDPGTQGHSARVSDYSVLIAQEMGLSSSQIDEIRMSSLLHDLGKIGVPEAILNKKGRLTSDERRIVNLHPATGGTILGNMEMLTRILPGVMEHHERLDGSGYPMGLKGEQISLMGRIVMVADVFDAMTSRRPYRKPLTVGETVAYLEANVDIKYDRWVVTILKRILERSLPERKIL